MLTPYLATYVGHITDTTDDNAKDKIESAYVRHAGRIGLRDHTVRIIPAHSTLKIGIKVSELINNSQRPDKLVLAVNCAGPDKDEGTVDNIRNEFFCAKLANNVYVSGTINGFELSYVKGEVRELYRLTNTNHLGSQFRSLEVLPEHNLLFSEASHRENLIKTGVLERVENVDDVIPSVPNRTHVFEVDNFANVKLYLSDSDRGVLNDHSGRQVLFGFGQASIEVNGHATVTPKVEAAVAQTLFAAPLNTNVLALKSSSQLSGGATVPMIAQMRKYPGETRPTSYTVPDVGALVCLVPKAQITTVHL